MNYDLSDCTGGEKQSYYKVIAMLGWRMPLPAYGRSGNEQAWFKNYPSRPFQYAHYENDKSELQPVAIVAPQGPILGPLLFLIQINDLSKKVWLLLHGTLERFCMEPVPCTRSLGAVLCRTVPFKASTHEQFQMTASLSIYQEH